MSTDRRADTLLPPPHSWPTTTTEPPLHMTTTNSLINHRVDAVPEEHLIGARSGVRAAAV